VRIGIDVGGTNTDAVLMDGSRVLAAAKTPTTQDVTGGIVTALDDVARGAGVEVSGIRAVMIGTTHFTNAVVEGRRLMPVGIIRLGLPATRSLPPMVDWPEPLRNAIRHQLYLAHGGHEFDGRRISPLDADELRRAATDAAARGIRSFAICAVFSPVSAEDELEAARIVLDEVPDAVISLSHEIGRVGLLERENATIMNACLRALAVEIVEGFRRALDRSGIEAPMYLSQNDGTLMGAEYAERYPVATFASGPTNSMRGAALLSGEQDCVVIDIGGTTSDIGVLQGGFPREAALHVEIGGVRTNFRMPDVLSLGIGGGSLVRREPEVAVGPESVGWRLEREAMVFGGGALTSTDVAVAAGLLDLGDRAAVAGLDRGLVEGVLASIEDRLSEAVDRMKTRADPLPVVLVGGGSVLLRGELPGAARVDRPPHHAVANAVGAAIAQVGGEVDRIVSLDRHTREEAVELAAAEATEKAVEAGAARSSVRVIDVSEVGLGYLPGNALRLRVRAVGELEIAGG
jgi:N-methylhydantoinase A/oxoprolinase/acetone carboxylase beta subunit